MESVYQHFLNVSETREPLALATLLRTAGSVPQVPGASALFSPDRLIAGTLGGGELEYESGLKAGEALATGQSLVFEYDLNAGTEDAEGAVCGGKATVLIDAGPGKSIAAFQDMNAACKARRQGALVTSGSIEGEICRLDERKWIEPGFSEQEYPAVLHAYKKNISRAVRESLPEFIRNPDKSGGGSFVFIEPVKPPEKLIIAGGGHVGKALIRQAVRLGFEVTVLDNRPGIIPDQDKSGGVMVITGDIGQEMAKQQIDLNTYIVIATQGHAYDADALRACIHSGAAYIGLMGSRRKLKQMRQKFIDEGWSTGSEFDAIHAPVGLDIHSETVEEIAVSIAAELINVRGEARKRNQEPRICNIILAAGESRRMRQQKLLMDFHGESFIRTIIRKSLASRADDTIVVIGSHSRAIYDEISGFAVNPVLNPLFKEGMFSSVQCGFRSIPGGTDAIILLLGDQPMVETKVIDQLIGMYRQMRAGIIIPVYQGEKGHPVLIDARYGEEIMRLDPEEGLRALMEAHAGEISVIEVDSPNILKDIDDIEDYKIAIT